jgi:hypothetical protein
MEFVLEQGALSEARRAAYEPRGMNFASESECVRLKLNCGGWMLQYAVMAEVLGRGGIMASQAVNCSAPDTGNMGAWP